MSRDFDIVIAGSGFAGSLLALIARRLGRSVLLLERGKHPRFAIGESSTPLANLLLEELAKRYDLPRLLPFTKWGAWQREHPKIACGLKRGFTFCHHRWGEPFEVDAERHRQLMVAASPHDDIADTHWFRAEFDQFLVGEARALGVEYRDECEVEEVEVADAGVRLRLRERKGRQNEVHTRLVIDASGPRGCLHRLLGLEGHGLPGVPETQVLYTHFSGVKRLDAARDHSAMPPYPPDAAAVHHVFPGGWMWVLHFNNGITSAGVSVSGQLANTLRLAERERAWGRLLARLPSLAELFRDARPVRPFVHRPRIAFRSEKIAGRTWVLLPSAAGFVDPLLSTGIPLTLLGVKRLAAILANDWQTAAMHIRLAGYSSATDTELLVTGELIGGLLRCLDRPAVFNALTQLYFAAASFMEAAVRLNQPGLAAGFLLHERPGFREAIRRCVTVAMESHDQPSQDRLFAEVARTIEPVNVAGLADSAKRNWYGCHAEDLLAATTKLSVSAETIRAMLERNGFRPAVRGSSPGNAMPLAAPGPS